MTAVPVWLERICHEEIARFLAEGGGRYDTDEVDRAIQRRIRAAVESGEVSQGDVAAYAWTAPS